MEVPEDDRRDKEPEPHRLHPLFISKCLAALRLHLSLFHLSTLGRLPCWRRLRLLTVKSINECPTKGPLREDGRKSSQGSMGGGRGWGWCDVSIRMMEIKAEELLHFKERRLNLSLTSFYPY